VIFGKMQRTRGGLRESSVFLIEFTCEPSRGGNVTIEDGSSPAVPSPASHRAVEAESASTGAAHRLAVDQSIGTATTLKKVQDISLM
jgi:hypothetical protein